MSTSTGRAGGQGDGGLGVVVALVPAKDRSDSIAATVSALLDLSPVARVLVVDDGSVDGTADAARAAGAAVLRLPDNLGKGGAVRAGLAAVPDADVIVLVDADTGATAGAVVPLLEAVAAGADMAIGVLPDAGGRGGGGRVKRLAGNGIAKACGFQARAPLSGQRAIRADHLRQLHLADRFGLETGLTIDSVRAGGRVVELDVAMDHRHTGGSWRGALHRAGQGADIVRALWSRRTTVSQRIGLVLLAALLAVGAVIWSGGQWEASAVPSSAKAGRVIVFGLPGVGLDDLGSGTMPNLDALADAGAVGASSVRTLGTRPSTAEAYATLGAGTRVLADDRAALAFRASERIEGGTAAAALARRTGRPVADDRVRRALVTVGLPATVRLNASKDLSSEPGALGSALHEAGRRTAVIGNADTGDRSGRRPPLQRPAAMGLADQWGVVDEGVISQTLLVPDGSSPFGRRADHDAMLRAFAAAADADVVLVDPGDLDRAQQFEALASPEGAARTRRGAITRTDELLGRVADELGPDDLMLVVAVTPPGARWRLTPVVAVGAGVTPGTLHSPSTRRLGLVTITDVAPTILDALGVAIPQGMIGQPLRYHAAPPALGALGRTDREADFREGLYLPVTIAYIVIQALVYLGAMLAFTKLGGARRAGLALRATVLGIAAVPLSTFVLRGVPGLPRLGHAGAAALLVLIDVVVVALALRARRHRLSPLAWIAGATVALLVFDVATGARLQLSSLLGYSPHTAARFTGLGNTSFATLAAATIVAGCLHVHHAPRRLEALVSTSCLFALVVVVDGWPSLGADVGGILTLVPVFGLTVVAMAGRRISLRLVLVAGAITTLIVGLATGIDLLRPPELRTHLGRLAADMASSGIEPFVTTFQRKLATNFRTWRSPWTWSLLVLAAYLLGLFAWTRAWAQLLPMRSPLRAAAVGLLAAGLLGYAVNDSGVVVAALVFVLLGPFLTLAALAHERGGPVLLAARRTGT